MFNCLPFNLHQSAKKNRRIWKKKKFVLIIISRAHNQFLRFSLFFCSQFFCCWYYYCWWRSYLLTQQMKTGSFAGSKRGGKFFGIFCSCYFAYNFLYLFFLSWFDDFEFETCLYKIFKTGVILIFLKWKHWLKTYF